MKIYDTNRCFNQFGQHEICRYCESSREYYESDTGYGEINCEGDTPTECQYALREFFENNPEFINDYIIPERKKKEVNMNIMELSVDLESLKRDIIENVKLEVLTSMSSELKNEIVKQVYTEVAVPLLDDLKTTLKDNVEKTMALEVRTYYTEQKIKIGGGWNEDPEEFTIQEYVNDQLKKSLEEAIGTKKSGSNISLDKHVINKCMTVDIERYMNNELKNIQKKVNAQVKEVFTGKVESMMSEVALGVLKSNSTYNDITKKLLG